MCVCVCVCVCMCARCMYACVRALDLPYHASVPCFSPLLPPSPFHLSFRVSENRIRIALQAVHPDYHRMRLNGASRSLNPQPYQAAYFGEKLHIDQNEKLVMFGVICQHASEKPCTDISTLVQVNSCTNWKLYISLFLHHKTIQTNTCGVWFI